MDAAAVGGEVAERSKALRQGRNLFGGVGSNPTLVTFCKCASMETIQLSQSESLTFWNLAWRLRWASFIYARFSSAKGVGDAGYLSSTSRMLSKRSTI